MEQTSYAKRERGKTEVRLLELSYRSKWIKLISGKLIFYFVKMTFNKMKTK